MQDELIFPASRFKAFVILVGCMAFVVAALVVALDKPLIGLAGVLIFGAGLPVAILMLRPGNVYLKLNAQGFEMATPFSKRMTLWKDVERLHIEVIRGSRMIAIVYKPGYAPQPALRKISSPLSPMEGAVPNSYAASCDEVLRALNEWHARYC